MKKLFFLLPVLILVVSCGKDDNNTPPAGKTKTEIISQASWKLETVGIDADKNGIIDQDFTDNTTVVKPCIKDNTLKFETNGTGTADEGADKCSTSPGQTLPFTWAFASNETILNVSGDAILGYGGQYKIITLSDTKLSLSKDTTYQTFATTVVVNFKH